MNNTDNSDNSDSADNTDKIDNMDNNTGDSNDNSNDNNNNNSVGENGENQEEYSVDSILGDNGDESEDITEALKRAETLRDPDMRDNADTNDRNNRESAENSGNSEFFETDNLDNLNNSDDLLDPDLDKALSQFADGDDDAQKNEEEKKKDDEDKKRKKSKKIKMISLISAICLVVIAAGIFAFFQINNYTNSYIMSFEGKKIKTEDFKFFLIYFAGESDVKTPAIDLLTETLIFEREEKARNITLTADELTSVKATASDWKSQIDAQYTMQKISIAFLEEILTASNLYTKLADQIAIEKNYTFDEADFAAQLEDYKQNGKQDYISMDFKYIITETAEAAEEARNALTGGVSADDAIKQYSVAYDEESGYGLDTIALDEMGFLSPEEVDDLTALKVDGISNVISLDETTHVVFITENVYIPTEDEIAESFRSLYDNSKKNEIFAGEIGKWKEEAQSKIKINQKVLDGIDVDALLGATGAAIY